MLNDEFKIQSFLSAGYLFILVLGILRDSLFYGMLGINIFEYASVMDVLLSPIKYIVESPLTLVIVLILIFLVVSLPGYLKKNMHKKWMKKGVEKAKKEGKEIKLTKYSFIPFLAILLASFFLGTGIGGAAKWKSRIDKQEFKYNSTIKFKDKSEQKVTILGKNSLYIFYFVEGDKDVRITPIEGNIEYFKK